MENAVRRILYRQELPFIANLQASCVRFGVGVYPEVAGFGHARCSGRSAFCSFCAVEAGRFPVFKELPNLGRSIMATGRKLVWVERQTFQGWACAACAWVFNPGGPP